jgi:hypothetical protein
MKKNGFLGKVTGNVVDERDSISGTGKETYFSLYLHE